MKTADERKKLEYLLDDAPDKINVTVPVPGSIPPELMQAPVMGINFAELREACTVEAKVLLKSAISMILSEETIEANKETIQNKSEIDIMSLSGMLYQVRVNEAMQKAMMEEVDKGFINPRMFEVFGQLSKTIGDLNKQLLQTVEAIKSTYKSVKDDIKEQKQEALGAGGPQQGMLTQGDGSRITMGTKDMIKRAKEQNRLDGMEANGIQDVTPLS